MKNNFPIKYAVMPVHEQTGYYSNDCDTLLYIVSKCFVIEESVVYNEKGEKKSELPHTIKM